ncbi:hypothetical protein WJX72_010111 [[Myrmecia] bisecta]|uniref:Uncharacterized protein n=1 Tax=[Myrmecia] bisecta TaxID=41462 RepID=A0AAW1Q1J3_9CHLO
MAAELLQALDHLWAEAIPDLNDIPVLSFKSNIGTYIVALASALTLLIRPAEYKDTSTRVQEAVRRLACALLQQPNDALEVDAERWAAGVRSPELDNGAIGYTSRVETLCQLVAHGLSHCEAMAVPCANANYVRAAYRLFHVADRLARHFGDDEFGGRLRMHVYSAAALVTATLALYKDHNTNPDIPPHKLVDMLRHNDVDILGPVMRTDFTVEVGTGPWHWRMRIGCKLLGLFGELATSWPLVRDTLDAVTSLLRQLPQLPLPSAGADQASASVRAANERVRDVAGDLVVALDKTRRQLSTQMFELVDLVVRPLFAVYDVDTQNRLLRPEAQKLLDVWLQPFRDQAGAAAAAEAAAAALLREEEAAAQKTKKNRKKAKQKKSKQSGQLIAAALRNPNGRAHRTRVTRHLWLRAWAPSLTM